MATVPTPVDDTPEDALLWWERHGDDPDVPPDPADQAHAAYYDRKWRRQLAVIDRAMPLRKRQQRTSPTRSCERRSPRPRQRRAARRAATRAGPYSDPDPPRRAASAPRGDVA
jgi:hypothetical protein